MKCLLLLLLPLPLFAQSDTLATSTEDLTRNRLFFMSTGYIQPKNKFGVQFHEIVGVQTVFSPTNFLQLNVGYLAPKDFIAGSKLNLCETNTILRAVSLNVDVHIKINNDGRFELREIFPNVNATIGSENIQFSVSLTSLEVEKMKYVPLPPDFYDGVSEDDGYRKEKVFYLFPAVIQIGIMAHSRENRIKFIVELLSQYEGKSDAHIFKMLSFGVRKYWTLTYFDFALANINRYHNPQYSETVSLPYICFGFFL